MWLSMANPYLAFRVQGLRFRVADPKPYLNWPAGQELKFSYYERNPTIYYIPILW